MKNKKISLALIFISIFIVQTFLNSFSYAQTNENKGKLIFVTMNRLNIEDFEALDSIGNQANGYIGLMNIRGAKGTNDASSYASIGWGKKSYVLNKDLTFFDNANLAKSEQYEFVTDKEAFKIANLNINTLIQTNEESDYGSVPGNLGKISKEKDLIISVIGNSDKEDPLLLSGPLAMDESGRIKSGNIDDINRIDYSAPFGISTNYEKVSSSFLNAYDISDIIVLELGDSYRLDEYKNMMSLESYSNYKGNMMIKMDNLLKEIKLNLNNEDIMIVASPFPSLENYQNGYRLAPIYITNGKTDQIGLLTSASTRRDGVISNIDISAFIAEHFELNSTEISGKPIKLKDFDKPWIFLKSENEKIVSLSSVRIPVLYTYAVFEMCIWILTLVVGLLHKRVPRQVIKSIKFILRITLLIPLVILLLPIFNFQNVVYSFIIGLIILTVGYAMISRYIRNDMNTIAILSGLTTIILLFDMAIGNQFLIKNSLLGYDPIIGARFYGIGNEYMGVLVGASLITISIVFEKFGFKNKLLIPFAMIVVFIMGNPQMGANVGGTITISAAFLFLILKSNNIKIDIKKIIGIGIAIVLIVSFMAWLDFNSENRSHLANTILMIINTGPSAIGQIIIRKISMNMQLITASMWSRVLILAIVLMVMLFYKPFGVLKKLCQKHPYIANGWIAILVGSVVGFMVNDSGVVAAATSISYVIVPMLVLLLNNTDDINFLKK